MNHRHLCWFLVENHPAHLSGPPRWRRCDRHCLSWAKLSLTHQRRHVETHLWCWKCWCLAEKDGWEDKRRWMRCEKDWQLAIWKVSNFGWFGGTPILGNLNFEKKTHMFSSCFPSIKDRFNCNFGWHNHLFFDVQKVLSELRDIKMTLTRRVATHRIFLSWILVGIEEWIASQ